MKNVKRRPPVHPGRILAGELDELGLSANAMALALRIPANRLTEIINGKRGISADTVSTPDWQLRVARERDPWRPARGHSRNRGAAGADPAAGGHAERHWRGSHQQHGDCADRPVGSSFSLSSSRSVDGVRGLQCEGRNLDVELVPARADHLIGAAHHTRGRLQRAPR